MKQKKLKINGLVDQPRWYSIKCVCGSEVMDKHPIKECLNCKFTDQENSMPKEPFNGLDEDGKPKVVTEITIFRGDKFQEVIGWSWQ